MSLVVATYVPEGIVMASDSRQSVTVGGRTPEGKKLPPVQTVNSDAVYKTFLIKIGSKEGKTNIGISTFGEGILGGIQTAGHIKKFQEKVLAKDDDIESVVKKIVRFFHKDFPKAKTGFHVAGYKKEGKLSTPYVFYCHVGDNKIMRRNQKPDGAVAYGATWSGQIDIVSSILNPAPNQPPKAPIIWDAMTLQDAIDFSVYAIRTTIDTIRFQARPKNVGGPIDVLLLTPEKARWVQKKELKGGEEF